MRHLILGSDTTLGSSIVRVLVSIGNQEIVCCNPEGIIPEDVPTTSITTFNVDIRNIQMLEAVLKEDDIVYNAQVYDFENVLSFDFYKLHVEGLVNLLIVANRKKVRKIITYLPQKMSWHVPDLANEKDHLVAQTKLQKSYIDTLHFSKLYFQENMFDLPRFTSPDEAKPSTIEGYHNNQDNLDDTAIGDSDEPELENEKIKTSSENDVAINTSPSGPIPPKLDGLSTENQSTPSNSGPKPPSLGPTTASTSVNPPTLSSSEVDSAPLGKPMDEDSKQQKPTDSEPSVKLDNKMGSSEYKYEVPLVVARTARFFGPFDYTITKNFCQGVRLQRMKIVGKMSKKISWINPLDAGRAFIIMADDKVDQGQYNLIGFNATGMELIEALDRVNHSKTKIRRRLFLFANISTKLKLFINKLGLINRLQLDEVYGLNRTQLYSDEKAVTEWNWKPKYGLESTAKDSLNWYVNHVL